ncbi:MAG: polysaccharide pyruvyl transferase family protein [Candidatus Electronema sp. V4]|uniref:polysaccharide pyruvyl transferase family protein n=1 Tax=Candidatus Electronema sp. V4 TaxID=3454756 RepID=UPI00405587F8
MTTITVLGNNSGRNAGDNAILGNLLRDVSAELPQAEFLVPTTNPRFIQRHFGQFKVKPMGLLPWNGCIKNFGWPLYKAMTATNAVLICDNILFDRKFYNPLFNYLSSIALFAPFCKKRGIPIVLYNASVGPIDTPAGKKALAKVLEATELAVIRDQNTKELLEKLALPCPELHVHADCALNTAAPPQARMEAIIAKEHLFINPKGTIGFNVNSYIDNWSNGGSFTREGFCAAIAEAADRVINELGVDVIFFVTQVMDTKITQQCAAKITRLERVKIISNADYTYEEIAALLGRVELHSGLRTHSLIFCAAMHTPMIGIVSYPKSAGFLRTVGQGDWLIPFADLTANSLAAMISKAWVERTATRQELERLVPAEKEKARSTAALLKKHLLQ